MNAQVPALATILIFVEAGASSSNIKLSLMLSISYFLAIGSCKNTFVFLPTVGDENKDQSLWKELLQDERAILVGSKFAFLEIIPYYSYSYNKV